LVLVVFLIMGNICTIIYKKPHFAYAFILLIIPLASDYQGSEVYLAHYFNYGTIISIRLSRSKLIINKLNINIMKKLILSAAVVLTSLTTFAQATTDSKTEVVTTEAVAVKAKSETGITKGVNTQEKYTEIASTEVPAPVHSALEAAHPGAVVQKAFINKVNEYKLDVKVADQKATLYADAAGNWIEK